jgi:hypothetical protein
MKKIILIILILQFKTSFAQLNLLLFEEAKSDSNSALIVDSLKLYKLSIYSNFDSSKIFIDSSFVGKTPLENYEIKEGNYKIKLINPNENIEWRNSNEIRNLSLTNDTTLNIDFKYFYYFSSNPFNASIIRSDTLFGKTPYRFFSEEKLTGSFIFRKKNYMDYVYDMNNYNFETGADVKLQSLVKSGSNDIVYKNRSTQFKTKRNLPAILLLGAASVAGAYFAIDYKNSANDAFSIYNSTGNNLKLDESNSNDTNFAISLVIMQLAIGGLIYFLFFDK